MTENEAASRIIQDEAQSKTDQDEVSTETTQNDDSELAESITTYDEAPSETTQDSELAESITTYDEALSETTQDSRLIKTHDEAQSKSTQDEAPSKTTQDETPINTTQDEALRKTRQDEEIPTTASPPQNLFERFKNIMKSGSDEIKNSLPHAANIRYGAGKSQKLDMFGLDTIPQNSPIWIYIHGGRWQLFDKNVSCHMIRPLLESNIRPVIADFDIIPSVNLEEMVNQIKDVVLYVLNYGLKNNVRSVWVCGHSSGGHLTATLLDYSWLRQLDIDLLKIFKGVVLISGVYDLTTLVGTQKNNGIGLDNARAVSLSPLHVSLSPVVTADFKILMAVGTKDDPYFIQEARKYYQFLSDAGAHVELLELPDLDHFDINLNLASPEFIITRRTIQLILSSNSKSSE